MLRKIILEYPKGVQLLRNTLRWRHNGRDSVSNHQPRDSLLKRLFRYRSKKTSKLRVTGLCAGNSPGTGEFPAQMASNAENVSIWWRHHEMIKFQSWHKLVFCKKTSQKVYVRPEVYVPPQDNLRLAYITAMYVEEFNLFLHCKQEKYINGMECTNIQQQPYIRLMWISYTFLHMTVDFPTKQIKTMVFLVNALLECSSVQTIDPFVFFWWLFWLRAGWHSFILNHSHTKKCTYPRGGT